MGLGGLRKITFVFRTLVNVAIFVNYERLRQH